MPAWRLRSGLVIAVGFGLAVAGTATANELRPVASDKGPGGVQWASDGLAPPTLSPPIDLTGGQHGGSDGHLPPDRENVQLVSKLKLDTPDQFKVNPGDPDIVPEQIADVAVYKNAAYLNSWADASCKRGGFFSVDISDPANPKQRAFIPALPNTYHGEGAHVITINTPAFQGDVLAVNNEPCPFAPGGRGGFDLYDVSDPANPEPLVVDAGDRSPDHADGEPFASTEQGPASEAANSSHSIFLWQQDNRAYAVTVDNTEASDVDIFDITDPTQPEFIADLDVFELGFAEGMELIDEAGNNGNVLHHDMVVKEIDGVPTLLVSYWDIGYIKLDVSDPSRPTLIGDSDFGLEDPLVNDPLRGRGWSLPEGNAHQAEFSHDDEFVLAADEDFQTHRFVAEINDPSVGGPVRFGVGVPTQGPLPTVAAPLNGGTRFVGDGCDPAAIPLSTADAPIAIIERGGGCGFQVKTENANARGYRGVVIFNNNMAGNGCEGLLNMAFTGYTGTARALFVARNIGLRMIGAFDPSSYRCTMGNNALTTPTPPAPRVGLPLRAGFHFDGWGYMHLYRNTGTNLTAVDHYAIKEGVDARYASGFGDLTVHEFATDPTENLAYSSYYSGGLRVMSFGDDGLEEVGRFIDAGGNNFWGVEQFTTQDGQRLIANSDRDFGLYLFRYTGPGAAVRPACTDVAVTTARNTAVAATSCTDSNGNPLTYAAASPPANGTLGADGVYTPNAGFHGTDTFTYTANDGAASSEPATAKVTVTAPPTPSGPPVPSTPALKPGACANDALGTAARDLLRGTTAGDRMLGGRGNDVLDGNGGDDCVLGEAGNDDLTGNAGRDDLEGGDGRDDLEGGSGNDELEGAKGRDRLEGGSGNDRLTGGDGDDELDGGAGRDTLRGGDGDDEIDARRGGRDTINCGDGRDTVTADRTDKVARNCETVRRGSSRRR